MNARTKEKALSTLDRMGKIVRHEMMIKGVYVTSIIDSDLHDQGAICGGRKHCAMGSLWAGYGILPLRSLGFRSLGFRARLPGIYPADREDFMRNRPGLKAAYEALNAAAIRYAELHNLFIFRKGNEMEELFESYWGNKLTKRDLLRIISTAKMQISKA